MPSPVTRFHKLKTIATMRPTPAAPRKNSKKKLRARVRRMTTLPTFGSRQMAPSISYRDFNPRIESQRWINRIRMGNRTKMMMGVRHSIVSDIFHAPKNG